jgi:hypothetical protein
MADKHSLTSLPLPLARLQRGAQYLLVAYPRIRLLGFSFATIHRMRACALVVILAAEIFFFFVFKYLSGWELLRIIPTHALTVSE